MIPVFLSIVLGVIAAVGIAVDAKSRGMWWPVWGTLAVVWTVPVVLFYLIVRRPRL